MGGLEELFGEEDYQKKGSKKGSKPREAKSSKTSVEKAKKGIRYPLPVRVRSGYICCNLLQEEFEGKTVSEAEVKNRIHKCYPELSGIRFNLVKFSNAYTELLERQEKAQTLDMSNSAENPDENDGEEELEFAPAQQEECASVQEEPETAEESGDEGEYDENEAGYEDEDEDGKETENSTDKNRVIGKGCWIKLEIHYQELEKSQEVSFPVSVIAGSTIMAFDGDTGSIKDVYDKWTEAHPEYAGCLFHYDDKQNMLIPFMRGESEIKGRKYKLPVTVGCLHLQECYGAEDFGDLDITEAAQVQVRELYARKHPEFENAVFSYNEENNHLFPVLNFRKNDTNDRYALPVSVRGPGFQMLLNESDFKGKDAVTLQEIRGAIEEIYPEFSEERTEMVYDERGFVVPILRGSRKGVSIISEREGQNIFFVTGRNGKQYRIEQMPYGTFDCAASGREADFHLCANKIPGNILDEIAVFFKREPCREAAVQVFYDTEAKEYELYYPEQEVSACSVVFMRNPQKEMDKVLVMDVHSHGTMPAFFSSVDDHDEKGTRLFMVAGKLDRKIPEWKLRAGIAGFYKSLQLADIFETEDCVYAP